MIYIMLLLLLLLSELLLFTVIVILFADNDGTIYILDRDQKLSGFKAYEFRTSLLFQMKQHNILASVGV